MLSGPMNLPWVMRSFFTIASREELHKVGVYFVFEMSLQQ